jgi:ABC-type iron transport system FetAB ATPase subunit
MKIIEIKKASIQKPDLFIKSFNVHMGDIIKIAGSSGIGKSTFLHSLVKLKKINYETFKLLDKDIDHMKANQIREQIIYVPQQSGDDQTRIIDYLKNLDQINLEKVIEQLAQLDIKDIHLKSIDQLSGGQRQALNLIIAMNFNRKVMICDESFSALDEVRSNKLIEMILKWKTQDRALIYVSHQKLPLDLQANRTYQFTQTAEITELKNVTT